MTDLKPPVVPMGPAMVAPFREVIHNISQFGEHWSWRCGVQWTRASEGWTSGACRYDHVVDSWDELVEQATAHLAKWHGIAPAGSVPDTGQDREARIAELERQLKWSRWAASAAQRGERELIQQRAAGLALAAAAEEQRDAEAGEEALVPAAALRRALLGTDTTPEAGRG